MVAPARKVARPVTLSVVENVPDVPDRAAARVNAPVEAKVDVAEPPKYAVSWTENRVEEACIIEVRPVSVDTPVTASVPPVLTFVLIVVAACAKPTAKRMAKTEMSNFFIIVMLIECIELIRAASEAVQVEYSPCKEAGRGLPVYNFQFTPAPVTRSASRATATITAKPVANFANSTTNGSIFLLLRSFMGFNLF